MSTSNNPISNTVGATISGVTNTLTVTNPSNTASSAAREIITVGGGTAADPALQYTVSGVTSWTEGIDNSDSDKWKLSLGTALGTTDTIVAFTTGNILKPRNCFFAATRSVALANVTGNMVSFTVPFDVELADVGGDYNNATGTFTVPVTGNYFFSTYVALASMNAAHFATHLLLVTTPSTFQMDSWQNNTFTDAHIRGTMAIPLTAGDTVTVVVRVDGGAQTVGIASGLNNYFCGYLVS